MTVNELNKIKCKCKCTPLHPTNDAPERRAQIYDQFGSRAYPRQRLGWTAGGAALVEMEWNASGQKYFCRNNKFTKNVSCTSY